MTMILWRLLITVLYMSFITSSGFSAALPTQDGRVIFRDDEPTKISLPYDGFNGIDPAPIQITEMRVRSEIALRYACTSVVTKVYNPDFRPQQATFRMLLPDSAFISNFTMILNGMSYRATIKEKKEASQIYNEAVSQGIGAAHITAKARDSNHFTVTVNVEGNSTAIFDLRYEDFLVRRNGLYNHAINLHPGTIVPKMDIVVHIKESQQITKLFVPEVGSGNEIDATDKDAQNLKASIIYGITKHEVTVTFSPDLLEQKRLAEIYEHKSKERNSLEHYIGYEHKKDTGNGDIVLGQFVIQYDVERSNNGEILVNDGYFVHFLAPTSLPPLSKHVVFVLDTSTSMKDRKIEQLRSAMKAMLSDLNPNDYFNIVEFNSIVKIHDLKEADEVLSMWKMPSTTLVPPARATPENIAKANVIVSELDVSGATNIFKALEIALNLINQDIHLENTTALNNETGLDSNSTNIMEEKTQKINQLEPIIIFLTDGNVNKGETSTARITTTITKKNSDQKQASLYTLAFGEHANRIFLRELSLRNNGFMRHIYVAADAALQLYDFYRQVSSPLLSHVQFLYPRQQIKEGTVSHSHFHAINAGSEVAVVGQIAEDVSEMEPVILGLYGGDDGVSRKRFKSTTTVAVNHTNDEHLPLERLWAYLTVKQLLHQPDNSDQKKALDIALKYAFVTPLTSLVVTAPVDYSNINKPPIVPAINPSYSSYPWTDVDTAVKDLVPTEGPMKFGLLLTNDTNFNGGYTAVRDYTNPTKSVVLITSSTQRRFVRRKPKRNFLANYKDHGLNHYTSFKSGVELSERLLDKRHVITSGVSSVPSQYTVTPRRKAPRPTPKFFGGLSPINSIRQSKAGPVRIQTMIDWSDSNEDDDFNGKNLTKTDSTTTTNTTKQAPSTVSISKYNLKGFEWTSSLLNDTIDALTVVGGNGEQIILKLTTDIKPPVAVGGVEKCSKSTSVAAASDETSSVCVYLTRCYAARSITAEDYQKSYCVVNDGYAGVCCPKKGFIPSYYKYYALPTKRTKFFDKWIK